MKKIICFILGLIVLSSFVYGFGVATRYHEGRPLKLMKGERRVVNLNLQNMKTEDDVKAKLELIKGGEIARIGSEEYLIEANTHDTMAPVKIKIPRNATGKYEVEVMVTSVPPESGGMITMATGMSVAFDVVVLDEVAPREIPYTLIGIIAGLIILIIGYFVYRKKFK